MDYYITTLSNELFISSCVYFCNVVCSIVVCVLGE